MTAPARLILITEQTRDWEAGSTDAVFAERATVQPLRARADGARGATVLHWWMPTLIRIVFGDRYSPASNAARLMLLAGAVGFVFAWTKSLPVSVGRPELRDRHARDRDAGR